MKSVGADFNMEPKTIADTGLLSTIGGRIAAGPEEIGTCTAATPASNIDYFIVDKRLQDVLSSVRVVTTSALKTHKLSQRQDQGYHAKSSVLSADDSRQ